MANYCLRVILRFLAGIALVVASSRFVRVAPMGEVLVPILFAAILLAVEGPFGRQDDDAG